MLAPSFRRRDAQLEQVVENIEKTFDDAEALTVRGGKLKHPTNSSLTPVSVLPDFDCWENAYVQASFDVDPSLEKKDDVEVTVSKARVSKAIMKEFRGMSGEAQGKSFIALLAPPEEGGESAGADESACELEWLRDYKYQLGADSGDSYFLVVGETSASYNAFEQTLKLVRGSYRRVHERPSKISLSRRELDEGEQQAADERRVLLLKGEKVQQLTYKSGVEAGGDGAAEGDGAAGGDGEDGEDPFGGADGGDEGGAPAEEDENENLLMDEDEDD